MPSTVISKYHYYESSKTLRVIFQSGSVYDYLEVPQNIYDNMKNAFSKGVFLNEKVKKNYAFKKIKWTV